MSTHRNNNLFSLAGFFRATLVLFFGSLLLTLFGFVWVFPTICLFNGLYGAAAALSVLGIFVALVGMSAVLPPLPYRPHASVLIFAIIVHLCIGATALFLMQIPLAGPWILTQDTDQFSNIALSTQGSEDAPLALMYTGDSCPTGTCVAFLKDNGQLRGTGYSGSMGWVLGHDPILGLWMLPRDDANVYFKPPKQTGWSTTVRPHGHSQYAGSSQGHVFLVVNGELHATRPNKTTRTVFPDNRRTSSVTACNGNTLLAVGPKHWSRSYDNGHTWHTDAPSTSMMYAGAACGGGSAYVFKGDLLQGELYGASPSEAFRKRSLPASDVRTLQVNPRNGREIWIGTWGQGVFRSLDGGKTWQDMGLQRIQVRTLAIDWTHTTAWAASANTIFDRGLFRLDF